MVNSQSQALNLQHGDQALHSLLQEWIAKQAKAARRRIKRIGRHFRIWMMAHPGHDHPISLQVSQSLPSTLQAVLRQSLRLTRTNEPTSKRSAAGHLLGGEHFEPLLAA